MNFLLETHCHTSETSRCGQVSAARGIESYKNAGYDGVVITDHFTNDWFNDAQGSWDEKFAEWLRGYNAADETGKKLGVSAYFGLELRLDESPNDYLLYGAEPELIYNHPELLDFSVGQVYQFAEDHELFFSQAHPFRPGLTPANPAFLHGIEAYNGNIRHNNQNDRASEYAEKHGLIKLSGSDYHRPEDLARGGIYLPRRPDDSKDLAQMLRENDILKLVRV